MIDWLKYKKGFSPSCQCVGSPIISYVAAMMTLTLTHHHTLVYTLYYHSMVLTCQFIGVEKKILVLLLCVI